jgi:hypothetical protein
MNAIKRPWIHFISQGISKQSYVAIILLRTLLSLPRVYLHHCIGQSISPLEWISKEFFHHFHFPFQSCKKSLLVVSTSPPLEEEGTHGPLASRCFLSLISALSLVTWVSLFFLSLCPYVYKFSCYFIS